MKRIYDLIIIGAGPAGIGIFILYLGGMIYMLSKADAESKRSCREQKEKK
jgi:lysine/ornithine N-monooxygenase